jgi:putative Holliday junction resolvase
VRVVGIDLGSRRIGVAVSDASGTIAIPRTVIVRSGDSESDRAAIAGLVAEEEAELVVVGLPVSMDGVERAAASSAREEAEALAGLLPVPVEVQDERLTTVLASRLRRDASSVARSARTRRPARRGGGQPGGKKKPIDAEAAAVMLQSWLDARGKGS